MSTIEQAATALRSAERILCITGAGLSADSGLPTYRGVGGLYNRDGGATEDGMAIEDALSGAMLQARPDVCWKYIHQIENACRGAAPNRGHEVIAEFEQRLTCVVLTQNVDGLHRRAGSSDIIEMHGDVHTLLCTVCSFRDCVDDYAGFEGTTPECPQCGNLVRPDIVLFGEMLDGRKLGRLRDCLRAEPQVVLSIGTTSAFPYIAEPVVSAGVACTTIEINPSTTAVSGQVDIKIPEGAASALDQLWRAL